MKHRKKITWGSLAAIVATGLLLTSGTPAQAHNRYQERGGCVGAVIDHHRTITIDDHAANNRGCWVDWAMDVGTTTRGGRIRDPDGSGGRIGEATPGYSLVGAVWRVCESNGGGCNSYQVIR